MKDLAGCLVAAIVMGLAVGSFLFVLRFMWNLAERI